MATLAIILMSIGCVLVGVGFNEKSGACIAVGVYLVSFAIVTFINNFIKISLAVQ